MTKAGLIKRRQTYIDKYGSWEAYCEAMRERGRAGAKEWIARRDAGVAKPRGFAANPKLAKQVSIERWSKNKLD